MYRSLKWNAIAVASLFIAVLPIAAQKPATRIVNPAAPRVFLLNGQELAALRTTDASNSRRQDVVRAAVAAAGRAMNEGPFSVMQKNMTPPSGDKHDYMSQAPYFWPDPSKPNGLPYIRHDGQHNPDIGKISDHEEFLRMGDDVRTLALASYLTGHPAYADRAAQLLRTWFLDSATKMNPNLEFAQGIPGINTGRGTGIIESRALVSVVDAIGLLQGSPAWTKEDQEGMHAWLAAYLHWLQSSDHGIAESNAKNNHGSWYDLQVACLELFLGDRAAGVQTLENVKTKRIAVQIEPDGLQPLELVRTNAWGYSNFNLDPLVKLATVAEKEGVDLWNYRTADGRSIHAAIDFLVPYASGEKKWDYQQIGGFHPDAMLPTLERAANAYRDPKYAALASKLRDGRDDLETLLLRGK